MGTATIIEQDGPRAVTRDEFGAYYFCCRDCDCAIETDGRRQAEDLMDAHDCGDME